MADALVFVLSVSCCHCSFLRHNELGVAHASVGRVSQAMTALPTNRVAQRDFAEALKILEQAAGS